MQERRGVILVAGHRQGLAQRQGSQDRCYAPDYSDPGESCRFGGKEFRLEKPLYLLFVDLLQIADAQQDLLLSRGADPNVRGEKLAGMYGGAPAHNPEAPAASTGGATRI